MKGITQKLALALGAVLFASGISSTHGQSTIVYFHGPSQTFQYEPSEPTDGAIDLNADGTPDFSFQLGYFICTADVPVSACSGPYYVLALGTNAILSQPFNQATVLRFGAGIGSAPPTNSTWNNSQQGATVTIQFFSARYATSGLYGPLADVGVGYVGVRFYAVDGLHYGWVRLRTYPFVTVVDWAYESRPNTPIRAGIIGSASESLQFIVAFPDGGSGSLILTGDQLRSELALNGQFFSAKLAGPAPAHAKANPIAELGHPLVGKPDYTSFFRDVALKHGEVKKLLRGGVFVSVDDGAVVGEISPLD